LLVLRFSWCWQKSIFLLVVMPCSWEMDWYVGLLCACTIRLRLRCRIWSCYCVFVGTQLEVQHPDCCCVVYMAITMLWHILLGDEEYRLCILLSNKGLACGVRHHPFFI
jgi:hypothetical protein